MRILLVALALLGVACDKKPDTTAAPAKTDKRGAVDKAIGTSNAEAIQAGKGAIVAQECALMCQAKPGIDPGQCMPRCVKECASATDTGAIDACAQRIADETPGL